MVTHCEDVLSYLPIYLSSHAHMYHAFLDIKKHNKLKFVNLVGEKTIEFIQC